MKIYGISGLGADKRVYDYLNLNHEFIAIDWIDPTKNESIESYSKRLSSSIDTNEKFGIIGVSFGGLIATEISKQLNPDFTILISTVEVQSELPLLYRLVGKIGFNKILPTWMFSIPSWIAIPLFKTEAKQLLKAILKDTDLKFTKWAVNTLTTWNNNERLTNRLKISGTSDYLLPAPKNTEIKLIESGGHLMIVDKADELSHIINGWINKNVF